MRAAVSERYGGPEVLRLEGRPVPEPGPGEIVIRHVASAVTRTDLATLGGVPKAARVVTGLGRPKVQVLGLEIAGHVVARGRGAGRFAEGAAVFGLSPSRYGGHAEHVLLPQDAPLAELPPGLALEEAVICEGAWYAHSVLQALRLREGQSLFIFGGGGAIGSAALQLGVARGLRVTVAAEPHQLALMEELGAAGVQISADPAALTGRYDAVLDAAGKGGYRALRPLLAPGASFAATDFGPGGQLLWQMPFFALTGRRRRVMLPLPREVSAIPGLLASLIEEGQYRPIIDRRFPLSRIAAAYDYVGTERKTGIVALDIASGAVG
ncbi:quinone oxidoreductase family protein [Pseudoroseicyclus tamaricis]|uniref:Zinc-binding dehydrogenase n=1 Tax=Pseudoroseicyclus tamaricis TaxID=2705421 RepID=A0A6B2JXJ1_9RHOB|nr:zinc-binding dehydrogenase [Pseudoroseicyclus tamaricis]NDV00994.1 zinc-binding dehydrogenase [Pseudoroseicyclus tamaricis]